MNAGDKSAVEISPQRGWEISEESAAFHQDSLICDMVFVYEPEFENDVRLFPRWLRAGVNFLSVHPAGDRHSIGEAVRRIARARKQILADERYLLVESADDVLRARAEGKLGVGLHLEGFRCLERDLEMISAYYQLGVRFCHPIFNQMNSIGGGAADRIDVGLSRFGMQVIQEMNHVGMLVDGSHAGYRATMDMLEVSEAPVIFSHVACSGVHRHFRNVRDDQIQACARTGGVIGITGAGYYLGDVSLETFFRHIDHVVQLVGPEHVGLGLDYLEAPAIEFLRHVIETRPEEWPGSAEGAWEPMAFVGPENLPQLTELLLERYPREAVRGILGENWLRVCRSVWK